MVGFVDRPTRQGTPLRAALVAGLLLAAAACATEVQDLPPTPAAAPTAPPATQEPTAVLAAVPPEVSGDTSGWPLPNRDYANTRAALGSAITAANVDELGIAWSLPIPGASTYGSAATNPIVLGDTVFFQDLESNLFALDRQTGAVRWEQRYDEAVLGPNGPAVGYGKVFIAKSVKTVAALNAQTGEELWATDLPGPTGATHPVVYDGLVYTSSTASALDESAGEEGVPASRGYAGGSSGIVFALDQATGDIRWRFQVVEEGFWGNPEVNSGGGIWYPPAIDTTSGQAFWGTGNPAPFPGTKDFPNGSSRPGPNLHTNSMLALDHATGTLTWAEQVKPHDLFDLDFQAPPVLATAEIGGAQREIVIGSGKLGRVIAFDRATGDVLWDTPIGRHQNDDLEEVPEGETVEVWPSALGGVTTPMAFADGTVYAATVNLGTQYTASGQDAADGTEALINAVEATDFDSATGEVVALDAATGDVVWTHELPAGTWGAVTVVNDLLFTGTYDGTLYALDRATGDPVWTFEAPAGFNGWPAIAGDMLIIAAGVGDAPRLFAFRIGATGTLEDPAPGAEGTTATTTQPASATALPATEAPTPPGAPPATEQPTEPPAPEPTEPPAPEPTAPPAPQPTPTRY